MQFIFELLEETFESRQYSWIMDIFNNGVSCVRSNRDGYHSFGSLKKTGYIRKKKQKKKRIEKERENEKFITRTDCCMHIRSSHTGEKNKKKHFGVCLQDYGEVGWWSSRWWWAGRVMSFFGGEVAAWSRWCIGYAQRGGGIYRGPSKMDQLRLLYKSSP